VTNASKQRDQMEPKRPPLVWRAVKGALVALVTAALGCGILYALDHCRATVRVAPGYVMTSDSLRLVTYPEWVTPAILAELDVGLLDPDFPHRFSLLDSGACERIARAYERCLWVEKVERIVKHDPRVNPKEPPLEVFLKFRRPLVFVEVRDGFLLLDERGVRLPGLYREPRLGAARFLVVTGVSGAPPEAGREWSDAAVRAALEVAEAVCDRREPFRLATIDMANFGGRRDPRDTEIALWTAGGTRIKWGKAAGPESAAIHEKTPGEKAAYLEYVFKTLRGQVDGHLSYIDIPNEAIRRRTADAAVTRVRS